MDQDEQRDAAEEQYNRRYCQACGASPCGWDGQPDGFHADAPAPAVYDPGLPFGCIAEITPGLAGWSWTVLREGTPADGGVLATESAAKAAVDGWLDRELDRLADALAYGIVLYAVAELGVTRQAVAAAFAAVALSDAFEDEDQEVHGHGDRAAHAGHAEASAGRG